MSKALLALAKKMNSCNDIDDKTYSYIYKYRDGRNLKKVVTGKLKDRLHTLSKKRGYGFNISVLAKLQDTDADERWLHTADDAVLLIAKESIKNKQQLQEERF